MTPEPDRVLSVVCAILKRHAAAATDDAVKQDLMRCSAAIATVASEFDRAVADRLALLSEYEALLGLSAIGPAAGEDVRVPAIAWPPDWPAADIRPSRLDALLDSRRREATAVVESPDAPPDTIAALRALLYRDISGQVLLHPTW